MRPIGSLACAVVAASAACLVPSAAQAQPAGFVVDRFDPSERGSEWFSLDSLDFRGHLRPALGVVLDDAYRPLVIENPDGSVRSSIVRDQVFAHLGASFVLWERLRLGASFPLAVYQDGHQGSLDGVTYAPPPDKAGAGDLRFSADARIFGTYGDPFTFAGGVAVYFPTGSQSDYTSDGEVRVQPRLLAAGDIGAFVYAARLGFEYRGHQGTFGGGALGSEVTYGASIGLRVASRKLVVGPEIYGGAIVASSDQILARLTTPVEGLLGAHYTIGSDWRIGAGAGEGLTQGFGSPAFRFVASVEWTPAPAAADRDHDGIPDKNDACPDVPGIATDDPQTNGCPPPPSDRDHDGVLDADDACPDVPGVKTDDPKTNGCPPDRDHDGILDADDACPDVPGVKTADPKTNGCPPDPDRDKDGIPNDADACPDEAGPPNPDPKKNGCPKAFIQAGQIKILDQVKFATASAAIVPGKDSLEVLDAVLKVLQAHPEIKKVRIEGHTDNVGGAAYNRKLSKNRAGSVMAWLIAHGVPADRLTSEGFGPDRPIDVNDTEAGRRNNRRVEFHLVEEPPPPTP